MHASHRQNYYRPGGMFLYLCLQYYQTIHPSQNSGPCGLDTQHCHCTVLSVPLKDLLKVAEEGAVVAQAGAFRWENGTFFGSRMIIEGYDISLLYMYNREVEEGITMSSTPAGSFPRPQSRNQYPCRLRLKIIFSFLTYLGAGPSSGAITIDCMYICTTGELYST